MLGTVQTKRMLDKLIRLEETYEPYVFTKIGELQTRFFQTDEQLYEIPADDGRYRPIEVGDTWGAEGVYGWFIGSYTVEEAHAGMPLFVRPKVGGYEAMLWVNGQPFGTFATKIVNTGHGNHYCDMAVQNPAAGETVEIAIEFYAGHDVPGCMPFEYLPKDYDYTFAGIDLCVKNKDIADFLFDLKTLNQLVAKLPDTSFRRAEIINTLTEVHKMIHYAPEDADEAVWRPALAQAREVMRPALAVPNSASAPIAGLIGHSHMDTAWLWHIDETIKKCARTSANQLSLMEQYPEYKFIQSSAYHTELIRRHYPALFERIREKVAEGRYEPNGAVWVECDCNITSGESMIRQFLWGQRYNREQFGYTSNCFWLPDTFGYSAAIPQIMKGCSVDYFLTTKLGWNDTNRFPYENFYWQGIDGTRVFVHFNDTHCWPDPAGLTGRLDGLSHTNFIRNKTVSKRRVIAYGFGDGGGGPQFEMIEMARRCRDLDGVPKAEHRLVGDFVKEIEKNAVDAPTYTGELYLELHRGTLTNQHVIKKNNRKAEIALHNAELLLVAQSVQNGAAADGSAIRPLIETLLVNQFHDILPGTCIARAHDQCYREMAEVLAKADALLHDTVAAAPADGKVTFINPLSFDRQDVLRIPGAQGKTVEGGYRVQHVHSLLNGDHLAVAGVALPAMSSITLHLKNSGGEASPSAFLYQGNTLTTPFAKVVFNESGSIDSFIDTRTNRELRGAGLPLNTFLSAEDVPLEWDNWDIDADLAMKMQPETRLVTREIVSDGAVELRIRSTYRICEQSSLHQDMVFYADSPRVDFETVIDWQDKHHFLKTSFDTTVKAPTARHEIQFGYAQKPTTRNNSYEQAMFEVVNHKYTDLSETRYGVAVLNDCKYGVSVEGSDIRLSLHKGGCRPDPRGDVGVHSFTYSFLPHAGGFSADTVVKPAYELNLPALPFDGEAQILPLASVDASNVMIEAVKPCEDAQKAFILRLYEAEGTHTNAVVSLGATPTAVTETNMLEEDQRALPANTQVELSFTPFEIKTIKISY